MELSEFESLNWVRFVGEGSRFYTDRRRKLNWIGSYFYNSLSEKFSLWCAPFSPIPLRLLLNFADLVRSSSFIIFACIIVPFHIPSALLLSVLSCDQAFSTSNCCAYNAMVLEIIFCLFHWLTHIPFLSWHVCPPHLSSQLKSVSRSRVFVIFYSFTNELVGIWSFVKWAYNPMLGNAGRRPYLFVCSSFTAVLVGMA